MQLVESKVRIRDCLADVYISEKPEWIAEEFSLVLGQQFNHNILNYQMILTQTRTFEYWNLTFDLELQKWRSGVGNLTSWTWTPVQYIHTGTSDFRLAFVTLKTSAAWALYCLNVPLFEEKLQPTNRLLSSI